MVQRAVVSFMEFVTLERNDKFLSGGMKDLSRSVKCDDSLAVVVLYED
jgi:hypothetical protein